MEKITSYEDLIKVIREAMNRRGITQKELAEGIGVKQPQINRVLTHKHSPSIDLVFKICQYTKVTLAAACPTISINEDSVL
jgi:transcriptional regulator with XRE-family HTH domain